MQRPFDDFAGEPRFGGAVVLLMLLGYLVMSMWLGTRDSRARKEQPPPRNRDDG